MNSPVPKQFMLLGGKPLLMHSMMAFAEAFPDMVMVLALPEGRFDEWKDLCSEHAFTLPHTLSPGGATRFHSVRNALERIPGEGLVAVHDGARPLITAGLVRKVFAAAEQLGNCVPAIPFTESVRQVSGEKTVPADRTCLRVIQTPQVFHLPALKKAYEQEYDECFTDDATVIERTGATIHLAVGDPSNIKITRPSDLAVAEALFRQGQI